MTIRSSLWLRRSSRFGRCTGGPIGGAFWFTPSVYAFDVEPLVVGIAGDGVDFDSFHQQEADAYVSFLIGREPYLAVDEGLFENEARTFLQFGEHAAGKFEIAYKVRFEARHVMRLFVYPNNARQRLNNLFYKIVVLIFRIRLEIENEYILPAKALTPRIHKLAYPQENLDAGILIVLLSGFVCLRLFLGLLSLPLSTFLLGFFVFFL